MLKTGKVQQNKDVFFTARFDWRGAVIMALAAVLLPLSVAKAASISTSLSAIAKTVSNGTARRISPTPVAGGTQAIRADLHPFWVGHVMDRESLFFLKGKAGGPPTARLLFIPARIISITSSDGREQFRSGRDYTWKPGTNLLTLTAKTRIPFMTWSQTHPPRGAPISIGEAVGGKTNLLWKEGPYFQQRLEVVATYTHKGRWKGYVPHFAGTELSSTISRLRARKPLRLVVLGDSISEGYSASGFLGFPPFQPAYPGLVADGLRLVYGSKIILKNLSVAGETSQWGLQMVSKVVADRPNLVIVAFGVNDEGGLLPAQFHRNIERIISGVRKGCPQAQFILVAGLVSNPEWTGANTARIIQYSHGLKRFIGPGIAVANLTAVWRQFLKTKNFLDLTGNGVNHPNDFGQRVYAQVIMALLRPAHR